MIVRPFRGVRYDPGKVGDLARVVTQPYDKIPDALRDAYHERHARNFARIIRPKALPGDDARENRYTRAARTLADWLAEGVLVRDDAPAIYACHQVCARPGGGEIRRKGFVAAAELEDFGLGGVRPHEATHAAPKADRLNLARATGAHTEPIFMLYDEPAGLANRALDEAIAGRDPAVRVADDFGCVHELWPVVDPAVIARVAALLKNAPCLIADGHHRYETALNLRDEMRAAGRRGHGADSFENALITFVNLHDPGLLIYPTHRIVFDVPEERVARLLADAAAFFDVERVPTREPDARTGFAARLAAAGTNTNAIGVRFTGEDAAYLLTLRDRASMDRLAGDRSAAWKSLDVAVLHVLLLERLLGITPTDLEHERKVRYARHVEEAVREVDEGRARLCFLLNPTRVDQVRDVALAGEKMPQKSTDFFPKLLSGLVLLRFDE